MPNGKSFSGGSMSPLNQLLNQSFGSGATGSSAVGSATAGLSSLQGTTSAQKSGVTWQDLYGTLQNDGRLSDITREWISSLQGGTQDSNNVYSLLEMMYANDLSQSNAEQANKVAQENAETAFLRQQQLDKAAMDFNANEAQIARDYQTEMSNTAYQRAVADLKKSGLNPILAYSQGAASTPASSGATYGGSSAQQASSYYAQTQRQQIDQQSKTSLIRAYIEAVSSMVNSGMNAGSNLLRSLLDFG